MGKGDPGAGTNAGTGASVGTSVGTGVGASGLVGAVGNPGDRIQLAPLRGNPESSLSGSLSVSGVGVGVGIGVGGRGVGGIGGYGGRDGGGGNERDRDGLKGVGMREGERGKKNPLSIGSIIGETR